MTSSLDPVQAQNKNTWLSAAALIVAALAVVLAWGAWMRPMESSVTTSSRLNKIKSSGVLHVGYGGWPPYTIIDPHQTDEAHRVTGLSVDLVNEFAGRASPPLRVQWHQFSWDTMKLDLAADRFDFIAEPVFETVPRAADFAFSIPYSYFGIAVAIVRADDGRFKTFRDLDRSDVTIALAEGWTSSEFARAELSKPVFKSIPVTGDALTQLDEVLFGRADAALNDVPTVLQYAQAHKDKVKALWLESPPSSVAGSFLLRTEDDELREFLNTCIRIAQVDGTIERLDTRWKGLGFLPQTQMVPGAGVKGAYVNDKKER